MTKEQYEQLDAKEKVMYDEMVAFGKRLSLRMEEIIDLLKGILAVDVQ